MEPDFSSTSKLRPPSALAETVIFPRPNAVFIPFCRSFFSSSSTLSELAVSSSALSSETVFSSPFTVMAIFVRSPMVTDLLTPSSVTLTVLPER